MVDPIDGTTNFASGQPMSAVSIGVAKDGQLRVGARALRSSVPTSELHRSSPCQGWGPRLSMSPSETSSSRRKWSVVPFSMATWQHKTSMNIDGFPIFSQPFPWIFLDFPVVMQPLEELLEEFDEFRDPLSIINHPALKLRPKYPCLRCQRAFRGATWVWEPH